MTDRQRSRSIAEKLYGPDYPLLREGRVPSSAEVAEWLHERRKTWTSRSLNEFASSTKVTAWARQQGLKRMDWDFIPRQTIWFREPEVAMLWDLTCCKYTTRCPVDTNPNN